VTKPDVVRIGLLILFLLQRGLHFIALVLADDADAHHELVGVVI